MYIYPIMKYVLLLTLLLSVSCQSDHAETIIGQWQVDSVATFYNGFTYRSPAQHWNETYRYDSTQVTMKRSEGSQTLPYYIEKDTLYYLDQLRSPLSQFSIVRLSNEQMILMKEKTPLWQGGEQTRYEIRYFSRTNDSPLTTRVSP